MPLYTGRGDQGETDLMGGKRVRKDHQRVEAVGALDELNTLLGLAASHMEGEGVELLRAVQNDLFTIGAEVSLAPGTDPAGMFVPLEASRVKALEEVIERLTEEVGPQRAFVLPGGSKRAAFLHHARAVARRAERRVVALDSASGLNPPILAYLNRLSTLLHALALKANRDEGVEESHPTYG